MKNDVSILKVFELTAAYDQKVVFANATMTLTPGEVLVIVGPSGCGKTTFLKCLNLLILPTKGDIWLNGHKIYEAFNTRYYSPIFRIARQALGFNTNKTDLHIHSVLHTYRRHFGMVFQEFNLWPDYTLRNNIAAPLRWNSKITRTEILDRTIETARLVQIEDILDKYPGEVSGGQRQRVAIARALAPKPDILLLDEITSALDPDLVYEVLQIIEKLAHTGITMVLVTHHMRFARRIADRIAFLNAGVLCEPEKPETFFSSQKVEILEFLRHLGDL